MKEVISRMEDDIKALDEKIDPKKEEKK